MILRTNNHSQSKIPQLNTQKIQNYSIFVKHISDTLSTQLLKKAGHCCEVYQNWVLSKNKWFQWSTLDVNIQTYFQLLQYHCKRCIIYFRITLWISDTKSRFVYDYHNFGHYPLFSLLSKTQCFWDWIVSPSWSGTYLFGPHR
jgi:hypothetical protein